MKKIKLNKFCLEAFQTHYNKKKLWGALETAKEELEISVRKTFFLCPWLEISYFHYGHLETISKT